MKSTTNPAHDVSATYVYTLTWIEKPPTPIPDPEDNSELGLIIGITGGVLGVILIGAVIVIYRRRNNRSRSQLLS